MEWYKGNLGLPIWQQIAPEICCHPNALSHPADELAAAASPPQPNVMCPVAAANKLSRPSGPTATPDSITNRCWLGGFDFRCHGNSCQVLETEPSTMLNGHGIGKIHRLR